MAVTASELHALIERDPPTVGPRVGHSCSGGTHSRLSDDRVVCWRPDLDGLSTATDRYAIDRYAIDAELAGTPVPLALERRWGCADESLVWPAWTRLEVLAKLFDWPIGTLVTGIARTGTLAQIDTAVAAAAQREGAVLHTSRSLLAGITLSLGVTLR